MSPSVDIGLTPFSCSAKEPGKGSLKKMSQMWKKSITRLFALRPQPNYFVVVRVGVVNIVVVVFIFVAVHIWFRWSTKVQLTLPETTVAVLIVDIAVVDIVVVVFVAVVVVFVTVVVLGAPL